MAKMSLKTTASQAHHDPTTISSGRLDTGPSGFIGAIGRNTFCEPLGLAFTASHVKSTGLSIELTGPARSAVRMLIRSTYA